MRILIFTLCINTIFACIDGEEVELWGECYNIEDTSYLYLAQSGLSGQIPPEIGQLTNLRELSLWGNNLSGEIPSEIGNLTNLEWLWLGENWILTGNIPPEIWNLTSLRGLDIWGSMLSGEIPSEIGNLENLELLWLQENNLSGELPSTIGNLTNLREIYLNNNNLSGSIPMEIGNLIYLERLSLAENQLTGSIPTEFGNLYSLERLHLERNQLEGLVPSTISNLTNLKHLEIWDNQLGGLILQHISNLYQLEHIEIDQNNFIGTIPSSIGNFSNLNVLWLAWNDFVGTIPSSIGNLSNLNTLMLAENQFSGDIPEEICNLPLSPNWENEGDMSEAMFNNNQFCPPYPGCIEEYIDIEQQDLSNCFICDGSDENELELWGYCYHTEYTTEISLPNSNLTGSIPQELQNFSNLNYLNLSENSLTGEIPGFICEIDSYALENNYFCGPFSDCLDSDGVYPQNNWSECDIYCDNNTEANLLGFCYNIEETTQINLANQALEGSINSGIEGLVNLEKLYLNDNNLSGSIPSEIGNLIYLERLYLNNNQFTGSIPSEIQNLSNLERLYLNDNQFSEALPNEIGDLLNLERLQLHNNLLSGLIPETICDLDIEFDSDSRFNISNNLLCPPYPYCVEDYVGEQDISECEELSNSDIYITEYNLNKPYPNPFNPTTTIGYDVLNFSNVKISIYNTNGQLIEVLADRLHQLGTYNIIWDAQKYPSGIYFVKLISGEFVGTQKIMLIK